MVSAFIDIINMPVKERNFRKIVQAEVYGGRVCNKTKGGYQGQNSVIQFCCAILLFCYGVLSFCFNILSFCSDSELMHVQL